MSVNENLVKGCCTGYSTTLIQANGNKIWAMELFTEVGDKYYVKVYDTDQFNPEPTVYYFETPVRKELCNTTETKEIRIKDMEKELVFVANHIDGICGKNSLYAYVKSSNNFVKNSNFVSFVISKNWFI